MPVRIDKAWWIALAVLLTLIVLYLAGTAVYHRGTCAWYGYQTERDTRYAVFVGCMVKVDNHWVPRHELRTEQ